MKTLWTAAMLLFGLTALGSAQVQKRDVDLKAPDGLALKATYYNPGKPGPAMLLLHQCTMDRKSWEGLASSLAGAGVHVVTLDYRGYGESGGERLTDPAQRRPVMEQKWPGDVDAAYAFLLSQPRVDRTRVAAGGASCGVTQSSSLATRKLEIKALVLLSGSVSESALAYIKENAKLAVFGAASEEDTNAAKAIKDAVAASTNPRSTIRMFDGAGHGVPMFEKEKDLQPAIVEWLKAQLSGKATS